MGKGFTVQSILLGLKRMMVGHVGEDIAEVVIAVLKQYSIMNKLGVFIVDNADSNDTAIKAIFKIIDL